MYNKTAICNYILIISLLLVLPGFHMLLFSCSHELWNVKYLFSLHSCTAKPSQTYNKEQ